MLLQPITVQFSKSTLKPSVYTLRPIFIILLKRYIVTKDDIWMIFDILDDIFFLEEN